MQGLASPVSLAFSLPAPINGGSFINPQAIVESFGLQEGMKVADFGSGAGHFALAMAKKVGPSGLVTALDIVESTLQVVRSKAAANNLQNVQTIRADLEVFGSTGLTENSQNLALLANILFQSVKKNEIVKEAARVLAPGGWLVIIDWKKDSGGLGPPAEMRLDNTEVRRLAEEQGLTFLEEINAGSFHFGLKFRK